MSESSREKSTTQPSFEKALERLDKIVEAMESGKLDLDTMIRQYEEGQKLIALCQRRLTDVERRVEALVQSDDGTVSTEPFEDSETPEA